MARQIKYDINWNIKPEFKDSRLVQCNEKTPIEKLRFPFLIDNIYLSNDFIREFKYSEFETNFWPEINHNFLDPKKSVLDQWIFEAK